MLQWLACYVNSDNLLCYFFFAQMKGLFWVTVVFFLSAENTLATMDQKWLADIVQTIKNKWVIDLLCSTNELQKYRKWSTENHGLELRWKCAKWNALMKFVEPDTEHPLLFLMIHFRKYSSCKKKLEIQTLKGTNEFYVLSLKTCL